VRNCIDLFLTFLGSFLTFFDFWEVFLDGFWGFSEGVSLFFWFRGVFGILRERVLGIPRKKWPLAVARMFNSGLSPCPHTTTT